MWELAPTLFIQMMSATSLPMFVLYLGVTMTVSIILDSYRTMKFIAAIHAEFTSSHPWTCGNRAVLFMLDDYENLNGAMSELVKHMCADIKVAKISNQHLELCSNCILSNNLYSECTCEEENITEVFDITNSTYVNQRIIDVVVIAALSHDDKGCDYLRNVYEHVHNISISHMIAIGIDHTKHIGCEECDGYDDVTVLNFESFAEFKDEVIESVKYSYTKGLYCISMTTDDFSECFKHDV